MAKASENLLLVRWDQHQAELRERLCGYFTDNAFVDVTLWCPDRRFKAHRVLLSACSDYLERVLLDQPCNSAEPVTVVLHGVEPDDLGRLLDLIYRGEAHVPAGDLPRFLETASALGVRLLQSAALRVCAAELPPEATAEKQDQDFEVKCQADIHQPLGRRTDNAPRAVSATIGPLPPERPLRAVEHRLVAAKQQLRTAESAGQETYSPKQRAADAETVTPLPSQQGLGFVALKAQQCDVTFPQVESAQPAATWGASTAAELSPQQAAPVASDLPMPQAASPEGDHLSEAQAVAPEAIVSSSRGEYSTDGAPHNLWQVSPSVPPVQIPAKVSADVSTDLLAASCPHRRSPATAQTGSSFRQEVSATPAATDSARQPAFCVTDPVFPPHGDRQLPRGPSFTTLLHDAALPDHHLMTLSEMPPLPSLEEVPFSNSEICRGSSSESNEGQFEMKNEQNPKDEMHFTEIKSEQYVSNTQLKMEVHNAKQRSKHNDCAVCGKTFATRYSLKEHMRTHTGEKPHLCALCGKRFSQRRNYRYHLSLHSGSREFSAECPECGKVFSNRSYLSSHMKIHRNQREYACAECGRRFNQRVAYNMHVRIHSGDRPHRCTVCDKTFSRKVLLNQHMRTHTGEKPFTCQVCDKQFADRSNMTLHARSHWGIKPYHCQHCGRSFSRRNNLRSHMVSHLPGVEMATAQYSLSTPGPPAPQHRRPQPPTLRSTSVIMSASASGTDKVNQDEGRVSSGT